MRLLPLLCVPSTAPLLTPHRCLAHHAQQEFFMQKMRLSLELLPNEFNCEPRGGKPALLQRPCPARPGAARPHSYSGGGQAAQHGAQPGPTVASGFRPAAFPRVACGSQPHMHRPQAAASRVSSPAFQMRRSPAAAPPLPHDATRPRPPHSPPQGRATGAHRSPASPSSSTSTASR